MIKVVDKGSLADSWEKYKAVGQGLQSVMQAPVKVVAKKISDTWLYDPETKKVLPQAMWNRPQMPLPKTKEEMMSMVNDPAYKEEMLGYAMMFSAGITDVGAGKPIPVVPKEMPKVEVVAKDPILNLKRTVQVTDIHGTKSVIPEGEALTPYQLKDNKVLLQDGQPYVVSKNQYQNVKGNAIKAEAKEFAPELKGTEETIKGHSLLTTDEAAQKLFRKNLNELSGAERVEMGNYLRTSEATIPKVSQTKYSKYTLPGGENYREVLIKAPVNRKDFHVLDKQLQELSDKSIKAVRNGDEALAMKYQNERASLERSFRESQPNFQSAHWDEPNVISHLRLNDRLTPDGKKVTFMEELQSDWAREARAQPKLKNQDILDEDFGKFPDNPLLKNWQELSIKRALKDAVDNGSDYLSWTTGEQQAARYNLSKQVNEIEWFSAYEGKGASIRPKQGSSIDIYYNKNGIITKSDKSGWVGKKVDEVVGKGIGEKMISDSKGNLSGEGLNIGGEWANNLYDRQVKNIVEDLTGGKVKTIDLGLSKEGLNGGILNQAIQLTPEIKSKILGEAPKLKQPSGILPKRYTVVAK